MWQGPYDLATNDLFELRFAGLLFFDDEPDAREIPGPPKRSFSAVSRKFVNVRFSSCAFMRAVASNSGSRRIVIGCFMSGPAKRRIA